MPVQNGDVKAGGRVADDIAVATVDFLAIGEAKQTRHNADLWNHARGLLSKMSRTRPALPQIGALNTDAKSAAS